MVDPNTNACTTEGGDGEPKLSKGELKKLAKKAEKASKKTSAAGGGDGGGGGSGAAATTPPPPKDEEEKKPTATNGPQFRFINPNPNKVSSTIKVVWTSQQYNIPIEIGYDNNNTDGKKTYLSSTTVDTIPTSGGGNAMALALSYAAASTTASVSTPSSPNYYFESVLIDEWCEWERTVLRHTTNLSSAVEYLNTALTNGSSSSFHLVGTTTTVADIVIVSTLATLDSSKYPSAVALYYNAHQTAYQKAIAYHKELEEKAKSSSSSSGAATTAPLDIDELMKESRLLHVVSTIYEYTIRSLYGNDIVLPEHIVKQCQNPKHGDYQCSAAMPVFAALKGQSGNNIPKNPPAVAAAIIEAIGSDHPILMDLTTQGPGFVLCKLRPSYLQKHVVQFLQSQTLPIPLVGDNKVCVVDFSSPNIAKEMHVGHLRSTIIGECVCRILEAAKYKVHRVNHVGDWGTQFGMLIQYLREEYPDFANGTNSNNNDVALPNITDLTSFYKNAKERFDASPEFKKQSQLNVVNLQAHDPDCIRIWHMLCDISRREFEKVYRRLDVSVTECGESFYNEKIPPVIDEFTKAGKIVISDEGGAKCVFVDKFQVPLMLQKSDGGYGYDSTDMAALKYRLFELKADRIIIITDFTQSDHFKMIYGAGRDIGWITNNQKLEHIGFGTVQGEDGKRFKTRSGDTVRLVDLLDEAVTRMESTLRDRIQQQQSQNQSDGGATTTTTTTPMSDEEITQVAEAIGYGAVKYFDLRRNPTSNYKFSYDQMLSTVGDTAVYLIYARVRLDSIISKAATEHNINIEDLLRDIGSNPSLVTITEDAERNLVFQLQQFADTMIVTLNDLYPFHVCEYVYKLATAASDFVTQCRVLDPTNKDVMQSRLLLCYATSSAMVQCFNLLGIRHVKRI